nr:zeta toxin family protein [uncultured Acinetobacter sp.]
MSQLYARPLNEKWLVEKFIKDCLSYNSNDFGDIVLKVLKEEILIDNVPQHFSTLNDEKFRHPDYTSQLSRESLREKIFEELLTLQRLQDDTKIRLGSGGAKPKNVTKDSQAIIVIGLPASGKSTISNKIADKYGAYIIDSDYAKLKLPEYDTFGANTVHKESTAIVRSSEKTKSEKNLLSACMYHRANIVLPTIGQSLDDVRQDRDLLIKNGYQVHLVVVSVKRETATVRALARFVKNNRYVPLGLIFDGYANDAILTYHRTKNDKEWGSYAKISTEEQSPKLIEASRLSPAKEVFQ